MAQSERHPFRKKADKRRKKGKKRKKGQKGKKTNAKSRVYSHLIFPMQKSLSRRRPHDITAKTTSATDRQGGDLPP
jgi:hypothetical protein